MTSLDQRYVSVRVPASTANLGPGFDCLGAALDLWDEITVRTSPPDVTSDLAISVEGEGADSVPLDHDHLIVKTIAHGLDVLGVPMPRLSISAHNRIPHSRGLGSSAAAIVAGLAIASRIAAPAAELDRDWLLREASALEGHPDNVAAAIFGGLQLAWIGGAGVQHMAIPLHDNLQFRVWIPTDEVPTSSARAVLPASVNHQTAVDQVARVAVLLTALQHDPAHLMFGTGDYLHQPWRESLMPSSTDLLNTLRAAGVPAAVSGAGPTIIALGDAQTLALSDEIPTPGFVSLTLACSGGVEAIASPA